MGAPVGSVTSPSSARPKMKFWVSSGNILLNLMLLVLPATQSRGLVRRSEEAVAPATGYLPAAEEDYEEDLPGYSADGFSLPGYGDAAEVARDSEGLATTTSGLLETTTITAGIVTTDPSVEAGEDSESPFSLYSHLSPRIRECPGSSMEVCVTACPRLPSARVYGACVQGCADRCPASP